MIIILAFIFLLFLSCSKDSPVTPAGAQVPVLTTAAVTSITQTMAQCGGNITSDGGATVTARGVCWSTNQTPTIADSRSTDGAGAGSFTSSITGLTISTRYYVRAYATNSAGTGYGMTMAFVTAPGPITDIDGNIYQTVAIGNQWWMAENLKVTHYRNGDAIPNVIDNAMWYGLTTGAYCEYDNDVNNVATYGRLYNWYAVNDSRNIAPEGWHVPSNAEWQALIDYLGGDYSKMKEAGESHWSDGCGGGTNESGFTALPGGERHAWYENYLDMGYGAHFWSSTNLDNYKACYRIVACTTYESSVGAARMQAGFSVRCVKD